MKTSKLLMCAIVVLMGITFCSCGNDEPSESEKKVTTDQLIGKWALVFTDEGNAVDWYWDIADNGILTYYEASDAGWDDDDERYHSQSYYKDGYVYTGKNTKWYVGEFLWLEWTGPYRFDEGNQLLSFMGVTVGVLEYINKDQIRFIDQTGLLEDGICYRIKGFN